MEKYVKIIAVEEHFHTKKYLDYLHSRKEVPKRDVIEQRGKKLTRDWWSSKDFFVINSGEPFREADIGEGRIKEMDNAGIDIQILSIYYPGVQRFNASDGTLWAKSINDELAQAVKRYSSRFAGFATIAPQEPESAANELERTVKEYGFKGAMISGSVRDEYLDDRKYWVIFEKAEKLGVPIYIHPGIPPVDMIKPFQAYPGLAQAGWGFGVDASLHVIRLIHSGVFDKYPGLKIVLGHMGESIPFWLYRIGSRPMGSNLKSNAQYFKDNFYVTISGMYWNPVLQFVIAALGADKIMFATDYPVGSCKEVVQFIKSAAISDTDREKICHINAENIFRL
jgi:predicted TIM-barrel fold metal-dependent hydrolase